MTIIDMHDQNAAQYAACAQAKAAIKLARFGMRHSRVPNRVWMEQARKLTGAAFGNRSYDAAISALEKRMAVLLVYRNNEVGG